MSRGTIMVTGGAGYIGSHVAWSLLENGYRVLVVDNLVTGIRDLVPPEAQFVNADIGETEAMAALLSEYACSAVMHFAGSTVVPESVSDPLKYYRNNTGASRNLIEACISAGVHRFIFSSTAAVYGTPSVLPVDETAVLSPESPYGASKLMTETVLRDVSAATPLQPMILRYFNVAGADPAGRSGQLTPNATHLIKVACEVACGKREGFTVFGDDYDTEDGTCVRDFIHVSDLAAAHVAALSYLEADGAGATLNCGYGRGFSVRRVLDLVEKVSGQPLKRTIGSRRPGDVAEIYAKIDRINATLDWKPRHDDLEEIVRTAFEWERAH